MGPGPTISRSHTFCSYAEESKHIPPPSQGKQRLIFWVDQGGIGQSHSLTRAAECPSSNIEQVGGFDIHKAVESRLESQMGSAIYDRGGT